MLAIHLVQNRIWEGGEDEDRGVTLRYVVNGKDMLRENEGDDPGEGGNGDNGGGETARSCPPAGAQWYGVVVTGFGDCERWVLVSC
jgi:hypothetical protein